MRLVDDDGEAVARQRVDLLGDVGEFLQRGDDDALARLQRALQLVRGLLDVLHQSAYLLEVAHVLLQLAVQHAAVGDDDDSVEDRRVGGVVERGQLVRQPGDGEALAAARAVLD